MEITGVSYIPVLNGGLLNCATRNDDNVMINGKRITFFTKDGLYKYNKYLINPYHHKDIFEKIDKLGLLDKSGLIIADSGGLQEITLKGKSDPEEVFAWQQKFSNVGFCIDSLPFITPKDGTNRPGSFVGWTFDKANFEKYAFKTKDNIDRTRKLRDKKKYPNFKFYGIIQGTQYSEHKRWFDIIRDDEYLDGYCCKASTINPISLAETGLVVLHHIKKPVHFLGVGNISRGIIVYYLGKYFKYGLTFDSSSYDVGGQYRSYIHPFMITKKLRLISGHKNTADHDPCAQNDILRVKVEDDNGDEENVWDIKKEDDFYFCDCPACKHINGNVIKMLKNNDSKLGVLISLHNLILNVKINNYVKSIINNDSKLKEFVKFNFEPSLADNIFKAFAIIDESVKYNPEYALDKYRYSLPKSKNTGEQKNVFDF